MEIVVLIVHLVVCLCLIGLVLLQRSEGGALGVGGSGGGSLMSGRGAGDALARMTSVAGGFFLVTSLSLTVLSGAASSSEGRSVFDTAPATAPSTTTTPTPAAPPAADRPDPTESSIPAATQLASISPGPAEAVAAPLTNAPAPNVAAARAGPLDGRTPATTAARTPIQTAANTTPARTTPVSVPVRTAPATTNTAANTNANRQLVLPNTSGSVSGISLDDTQTGAESVEAGNTLEAVRRERAGPDQ